MTKESVLKDIKRYEKIVSEESKRQHPDEKLISKFKHKLEKAQDTLKTQYSVKEEKQSNKPKSKRGK